MGERKKIKETFSIIIIIYIMCIVDVVAVFFYIFNELNTSLFYAYLIKKKQSIKKLVNPHEIQLKVPIKCTVYLC